MKFLVIRTSNNDDEKRPCDERLTFEEYDRIEVRTCSEEEFNTRFAHIQGGWRTKGINHTTCNNGKYIKRTFPKENKGWFLEISTLEELIEFSEKVHCDLIIGKHFDNDEIFCIEIYDDYRE